VLTNIFGVSSTVVCSELARLERAFAEGNVSERMNLALARGQTQNVLFAINQLLDRALQPVAQLGERIEQ